MPAGHTGGVSIEVRYENERFHLMVSPPHSVAVQSEAVDSAFLAVSRLRAWGCHTTDIADVMDATGCDWRTDYDSEVLSRRSNPDGKPTS